MYTLSELGDSIKKAMEPGVQLISSGDETALEVSAILDQQNLLSSNENVTHTFFTTGNASLFSNIASALFQEPLENVQQIKL